MNSRSDINVSIQNKPSRPSRIHKTVLSAFDDDGDGDDEKYSAEYLGL